MPTISLVTIISSQAAAQDVCWAAAIADEIIAVRLTDNACTENTRPLCSLNGEGVQTIRYYEYSGPLDMADAWNFAFSKATMDYIFWLDIHEDITPSDAEMLLRLKVTLPADIDVVMMGHSPRLLKRENQFLWFDPVHPLLMVWGKKLYLDLYIEKHGNTITPSQCVTIYRNAIKNQETFSSRAAYFFARALEHEGFTEEAVQLYRLFYETAPFYFS